MEQRWSRQHTMLGEVAVNFAPSDERETDARANVKELSASKVPACRMSWVAVPEAKRRPGPKSNRTMRQMIDLEFRHTSGNKIDKKARGDVEDI